MKTVILCEGQNDITVLPVFLRKIYEQCGHTFTPPEHISRSSVKKNGLRSVRPILKGQAMVLRNFLMQVQREHDNADVLIFQLDSDRPEHSGHDVVKKTYEAFTRDVLVDSVKSHPLWPKLVMAFMITMLESWLLADLNAFKKAFSKSVPKKLPVLPSKPEECWGDESDKDSFHPKCILKKVLADFSQTMGSCAYADLAQEIDFETLAKRCPVSFPPFYQQLHQILGTLTNA